MSGGEKEEVPALAKGGTVYMGHWTKMTLPRSGLDIPFCGDPPPDFGPSEGALA